MSGIADIVESLGVTLSVRDDDLVTDVVVIAKVVEADGSVRLALTWSEGMSWIERYGLLTAATVIDSPLNGGAREDDDE